MGRNRLGKINGIYLLIGIFFFIILQPFNLWAYEKEIRELSSEIADNIASARITRIAVVNFTDLQGNVTQLGRFIADEFAVGLLSKSKGFEIVDRTHLQTLIKEHKLSTTGLIDPATAQKLGQIAGVDALVTGFITPLSDSINISVKILNAKTARWIGGNSAKIPITADIKSLLANGIQVGGNGGTSSKKKEQKSKLKTKQEVEANGFSINMQKCERTGSTVIFYFIITNNKEERHLCTRTFKCRIFDNLGNESTSASIQVGKTSSHFSAGSTLISGVPVKASVTFEKVSSKADFIKLLEINWESDRNFKIQFRDIQFSK